MSGSRVSLNEILRLARRVLLALGAGPGCEYEPARAVVWLESRGLPGLMTLWRDCERPPGAGFVAPGAIPGAADSMLRLDGGGASGAWIAAAAVDWLVAHGEAGEVTVEAVRSPLWFIPDLALRGGASARWMTARDAGGRLLMTAVFDDRGPVLQFGRELRELAGCEATVCLGHGALTDVESGALRRFDAGELDTRFETSILTGIAVDEASWVALYEIARGALVPETAASRARGAGGPGQ